MGADSENAWLKRKPVSELATAISSVRLHLLALLHRRRRAHRRQLLQPRLREVGFGAEGAVLGDQPFAVAAPDAAVLAVLAAQLAHRDLLADVGAFVAQGACDDEAAV